MIDTTKTFIVLLLVLRPSRRLRRLLLSLTLLLVGGLGICMGLDLEDRSSCETALGGSRSPTA